MRFRPLLVVLVAMNPLIALAQNPPATECHTLESTGNFLGPDETIVNGLACKTVKAGQQMLASSQPARASTTQRPESSDPDITNRRVIEMTKLGLDDDIIIARIRRGPCDFQLSDNDLLVLKNAGLSSKVVAAMLDAAPVAAPPPQPTPSDGKVCIFVTDNQSWEMRGSSAAGGSSKGWGASSSFSGGARPQTAEIVKTLNQRCPELTVTNILGKADFVVVLDHEGGKGLLRHRNKIAVFNHDGDDIFSDSTRELGNAVKDACAAMTKSKK